MASNNSRTTKAPFPLKTENLAGTSDIMSKLLPQHIERQEPLDSVETPRNDGIPPTVDQGI
jgi:hypothetical protein